MTLVLVILLAVAASLALASVVIEVPAEPDEVCCFAAEELTRYLDRAAGTTVCRPAGRADVVVSLTVNPEMPGSSSTEAFAIQCAPGHVGLVGRSPRAVLYAVYELLQRAAGCRFFYPGEDIVPALGQGALMRSLLRMASSGQSVISQPDFDTRMVQYLVYDLGPAGSPIADRVMRDMLREIDWMAKNRMNVFQFALDHNFDCATHWPRVREAIPELRRRGTVLAMGGHNMHMFMTAEDLKQHPDWGPFYGGRRQTRGQFCTRNEQAVAHYIDGLKGWLRDNPEVEYFAPWPNDTGGWCECELCRDTPMPDRFMQLGQRIHRELAAAAPHVRVTHFAYGSHVEPPKVERPLPGMSVTLCTWGRDLSQQFFGEGTPAGFRQASSSWLGICREANVPMILHEKYARHLYIGHHTMPVPVMQEDLQWFRSQGLSGFELPMAYMGRRTKGLNLYTLARLMWDADARLDELWDDYFAEEYGPLAGHMRPLYESLARAADDFRYSFDNYSHLGRQIQPGQQVRRDLRHYAVRVTSATHRALQRLEKRDHLTESLWDQPEGGAAILARVDRFRRSLEYLQAQWASVLALAQVATQLDRAASCDTQDEYVAELAEAASSLEWAERSHREHVEMAADLSELDLHWDVTAHELLGGIRGESLERWRELIVQAQALGFAGRPTRVWQIGVFDGSALELGEGSDQREVMLRHPPVVSYRVPEDWREREQWPDFPRSHWPGSLRHGARIELVSDCSAGRYRLTVGQIATGEPETVPVLVDGAAVGQFTTIAGRSATHEVEFSLAADGQYTVALGEFESGGGYMLDALRLERLPEA